VLAIVDDGSGAPVLANRDSSVYTVRRLYGLYAYLS